jgi:hypothetical protein
MDINAIKESNFVKYTGMIFIGIVLFVMLYKLLVYYNNTRELDATFFGVRDLFGQFRDTTKPHSISASRFKLSQFGREYSYSFWFKVDNWNYLYGTPKHIFHSGDQDMTAMSPGVFLHPTKNQLIVRVDTNETSNFYKVFTGSNDSKNKINETLKNVSENDCRKACNLDTTCGSFTLDNISNNCTLFTSGKMNLNKDNVNSSTFVKNKGMNPSNFSDFEFDPSNPCDLVDIPLQRWNHVVIVLMNRNLDVYLNGKLARSCALRGIPSIYNNGLFVTQNGGFKGDMANLRYFNRSISASEVYDIYKQGPERLTFGKKYLPNIKIKLTAEASSDE